MGLIKAAIDTVSGVFADQWLEVFEPDEMIGKTIFVQGVSLRQGQQRQGSNTKGTSNIVSNGSKIHVNENQMMILVDGGKIIQTVAEAGYYTVDNSTAPSFFNGQFGATFKDAIDRYKFGGAVPNQQKIYYINMKEISGIKYGTPNPIAYYDESYDAELFLRAHGDYSIKIVNPIKFYKEVLVGNTDSVSYDDISEQYNSEFLTAFQEALGKLSADGESIRKVSANTGLLAKTLQDCLDEDWTEMRGMQVQKVGLSVSYDDESKELLKARNKAAMFKDPTFLNAHVQSNIAEGMKAAGSNPNGAMNAFMGMGMGMNSAGNFMGGSAQASQMAAQQSQQQQMQQQQMQQQQMQQQPVQQQAPQQPVQPEVVVAQASNDNTWTCECGANNTGRFCAECGKPVPPPPVVLGEWACECGAMNKGKFCAECGKPNPTPKSYRCDKCGYEPDKSKPAPKFCPECGDIINNDDIIS